MRAGASLGLASASMPYGGYGRFSGGCDFRRDGAEGPRVADFTAVRASGAYRGGEGLQAVPAVFADLPYWGRILFTYNPFDGLDPSPSPGPVFHEENSGSYAGNGFPEEMRSIPLVLEAYGDERSLVAQECVRDGVREPTIEMLLARSEVHYRQVRNLEAGCFIATVRRENQPTP